MAIETAMADYNTVVANTLGARPKSTLWNCLHDIRLLLLRMAYGEALGADCGGGSSSSNFLLLLYQLYSADLLAKNGEHDESLAVSRHARDLSAGYLVAMEIVDSPDFDRDDTRSKRLEKGVACEFFTLSLFHCSDNMTFRLGLLTCVNFSRCSHGRSSFCSLLQFRVYAVWQLYTGDT